MKRLSVVLLAVVLVTRLQAAEGWTYAASEHFDVYTTAGARTARDALTYFERVHTFFSSIFKFTPKLKERTRLIVFANDKQFAPYRPVQFAAAFYQGGADRDYIVMKSLDEESMPIVVHEYAHLYLRYFGGQYPVWLNEGLAEVFSTMTMDRNRVRFGDPQPQHLAYLKSGVALFDLKRLFGVGQDSPEYNTTSHAGVLYAQSWALVHMLFVDDRYRPKFDAFLNQVLHGVSSADALLAVYGKSTESMGLELFNYIGRSQFLYLSTKDTYKIAAGSTFETRAADAFEGALVTTNLQANSARGEETARASFQKLEQEKPNDLSLLESRAYFEWRRGNRAAALPYFERAVAQGSRNVKLIYDYARIDPSKAAVLLPKALELAPDNIDIRLDNARLLLNERKAGQTVVALSKMDELSREQTFKRYLLLANAYLLLNEIQAARSAATLAGRNADSEESRGYVTRLLTSIDEYAEQRATYEERLKASNSGAPAPSISVETIRPPVPVDNSQGAGGALILVDGRLRNVICPAGEKVLILELLTSANTFRLLLDSPAGVTVRGRQDGTVDLRCEAQDQPITIGFVPGNNLKHNTEGSVRSLDFGK